MKDARTNVMVIYFRAHLSYLISTSILKILQKNIISANSMSEKIIGLIYKIAYSVAHGVWSGLNNSFAKEPHHDVNNVSREQN